MYFQGQIWKFPIIGYINMAWSTNLFCNIEFNRETFNSKDEVSNKIEELESYIETAKKSLRDLTVITEPNKFCPKDEDPLCWLITEFNGQISLIEEYSVELYKLYKLLDSWDKCHDINGLAIDPPNNIQYDTVYLTGDFVRTIKHPNANDI